MSLSISCNGAAALVRTHGKPQRKAPPALRWHARRPLGCLAASCRLSSSVAAALIAAYNASLAAPPKLPKQSKAGGAVASAPASQRKLPRGESSKGAQEGSSQDQRGSDNPADDEPSQLSLSIAVVGGTHGVGCRLATCLAVFWLCERTCHAGRV